MRDGYRHSTHLSVYLLTNFQAWKLPILHTNIIRKSTWVNVKIHLDLCFEIIISRWFVWVFFWQQQQWQIPITYHAYTTYIQMPKCQDLCLCVCALLLFSSLMRRRCESEMIWRRFCKKRKQKSKEKKRYEYSGHTFSETLKMLIYSNTYFILKGSWNINYYSFIYLFQFDFDRILLFSLNMHLYNFIIIA